MVIRRVSPLSCAKIAGILYLLMGLVIGAFFSLFAATMGRFAPSESSMGMLPTIFGAAAVVVLPIVYGVIGAIVAAISAVIYNIAAKVVGGIEIDVETAPAP